MKHDTRARLPGESFLLDVNLAVVHEVTEQGHVPCTGWGEAGHRWGTAVPGVPQHEDRVQCREGEGLQHGPEPVTGAAKVQAAILHTMDTGHCSEDAE